MKELNAAANKAWMAYENDMGDDYVAFRDCFVAEFKPLLEAERGKAAKLVEILEAVKYEDEVNGKGWENNHNSTYSRLCRVLEDYKKGV